MEEVCQRMDTMEGKPEISRRKHDFVLPALKWGNQKILRSVKIDPNESNKCFHMEKNSREQVEITQDENHDGNSDDSMKPYLFVSYLDCTVEEERAKFCKIYEEVNEFPSNDVRASEINAKSRDEGKREILPSKRPWNLRTRRAACNSPEAFNEGKNNQFRLRSSAIQEKAKTQRVTFSISLKKAEIEADFLAMTKSKRPRRSKKRPKNVQKQVDTLLPGQSLFEITPETYRVSDIPVSKK